MTSPHIQLGPFVLDEIIGRGGMGEIWKGVHVTQRVPVAVKVVTEHGARREDYLRQFRNEIRSVAGLDHPGVVIVFDHGEITDEAAQASGEILTAGSPYLVMEFAQHGSLDRYISGMNWPILRHILFNVLDALAHAHARGVVHRDLKPQNILVGCARKDGLGLKLADFGLAHPLDLTGRTGKYEQGWGTPHYMAAEQFRGLFRDYGPWTDLYALGVVAWELTTGVLPFNGANIVEISGKHLHGTLPAYEPRFEVPRGFAAWVHRLLQKSIYERFQTAADAAFSLARIVGAEPDALEGRQLAGEHAHTVPIHAGNGETSPFTQRENSSDADTILEVGATTRLILNEPQLSDMHTRTLTIDVAQWLDDPFGNTPAGGIQRGKQLADKQPAPLPDDWRQPEMGEPSPQLLGAGLGLFGLRTVRLVDRADERDWLWEQLSGVHEFRETRVVLLKGRAGTGKSRLARWLGERASEVGGATVLTAVHSPISGPADGLSGMAARFFGCVGLEREDVQRRLEKLLHAQGVTEPYEWNALTELIQPAAHSDVAGETMVRFTSNQQRYALLRRMVERLARNRPVLMWLDDVQWGADALGFVDHLLEVNRAAHVPIFLVMTAREEALTSRTLERSLVKRLLRTDKTALLPIDPLAPEDTSELVRRLLMLEGELAAQVEARSDGNPLFAVQLVDDWVSSGKLSVGEHGFCLSEGEEAQIPDDIHKLWRSRIEQLVANRSEYSRVALELASALGQEVERREWEEGCEFLGMQVDTDLEDNLYARGLARPLEGGWRFVHGMLRESLERLAREADRWEWLNSICADILEDLYDDNRAKHERRAHYLIEATRLQEAVEPLVEAARFRSERSDFGRAHELLDRRGDILSTLDTPDSAGEWGLGWVLRSEIYELEANYSQALTWAKMAVEHARGHEWRGLLAPSLRAAGGAHLHLANFDRARDCFEEARQLADERDDAREIGLALLGLGRVEQSRGNFEAAKAHLEESAELLTDAGDEQGLARCYNARGDIARQTRQISDARRFAESARALFDAGGNQVGVADCLNDLSELNHLLGDVDLAEDLCARALHLYESVGSQQSMRVRLHLAFILLHRGEFGEARSVLASAREHFEREDQLAELAHADVLLLACAASEADWVVWDELVAEAERLHDQTGLRAPRIARAATIAAEVAEEQGETEREHQARALSGLFSG